MYELCELTSSVWLYNIFKITHVLCSLLAGSLLVNDRHFFLIWVILKISHETNFFFSS